MATAIKEAVKPSQPTSRPEPIRAVASKGTPLALDAQGLPIHALTGQPLRRQGYKGEDEWDIGARQDEDKQRYDEWAALSSQEKSQLVADRRYTEGDRYQVSIPKDRAQITLVVRGHSEAEAREHYRQLCGIGSCDHPIEAVNLDSPVKKTPAKGKRTRGEDEPPISSLGIERVEESVNV